MRHETAFSFRKWVPGEYLTKLYPAGVILGMISCLARGFERNLTSTRVPGYPGPTYSASMKCYSYP